MHTRGEISRATLHVRHLFLRSIFKQLRHRSTAVLDLKKKVGYFNERHLVKKPKYNLSRPLMVVQRSCCRTYIRLWLHVGSIRYDINSVIGIRSNGLHSHGFLLLFCSKKTCVVGCDGTREVPMTQQFFVSELLPNQGLCTVAHSQWFSGS